jgi:hypothetical protein
VTRSGAPTPIRTSRRWVAVVVAVLASVTLAAGLVTTLTGATATQVRARHEAAAKLSGHAVLTSTTPADLPSDCLPNGSGPPSSPYQLGLVGTVHGGAISAGPARVDDIDLNFCGVVTVVPGSPPCYATTKVVTEPDDQVFTNTALHVTLTMIPGMTPSIGFTPQPGPISGSTPCASSSHGLQVALDATVEGSTTPVFGVSCTIGPFTIPLRGSVTGPLTHLTGTVSSSSFSVPAITPTTTCPSDIADNVDEITGLPLPAGRSSAALPVTAYLYQPASSS